MKLTATTTAAMLCLLLQTSHASDVTVDAVNREEEYAWASNALVSIIGLPIEVPTPAILLTLAVGAAEAWESGCLQADFWGWHISFRGSDGVELGTNTIETTLQQSIGAAAGFAQEGFTSNGVATQLIPTITPCAPSSVVSTPITKLNGSADLYTVHAGAILLGPRQITSVPLGYGFFCATYDLLMAIHFYTRRNQWQTAWSLRGTA